MYSYTNIFKPCMQAHTWFLEIAFVQEVGISAGTIVQTFRHWFINVASNKRFVLPNLAANTYM